MISLISLQFSLKQPSKQWWGILSLCHVNWLAFCHCVTLTKTSSFQQCFRSLIEFAKVRMVFLIIITQLNVFIGQAKSLLKNCLCVIFVNFGRENLSIFLRSKESEVSPADMSLNRKLNYMVSFLCDYESAKPRCPKVSLLVSLSPGSYKPLYHKPFSIP